MKKIITLLVLFINIGLLNAQDYETEHFNFYIYNNVEINDILDIADSLEYNYSTITNDFNIDNLPILVVKVWDNYTDFLDSMEFYIGQRYEGATGYVTMNAIMLYDGYNTAHTFAVHEFAHIVSLKLNSTIGNNPRWLWETFAIYVSKDFTNPATLSYIKNGNYPTLQELNVDFYNGGKIYQMGYVIGEFIVKTWGFESFVDLIKNNGNLQSLLGINATEFENQLYQFIEEKYLGISSLQNNPENYFNIYPNPTNGLINVEKNDEEFYTLKVFNMLGQTLLEKDFVNSNVRIDISNYPDGIYYIGVGTSDEYTYQKLTKK